ncbi:MAG: NAD-dependent epimerase/dehydratase family protein [Deinococcales bacterium]
MKKVLITGSTGFIGSHLVDRLLEQGQEVRVLTRTNSKKTGRTQRDGLEHFVAELTTKGMTEAAKDCAVVYHLGGITRASSAEEFLWANAEGTRAAAVGAVRNGARLVYVSSLAAAGVGTVQNPRKISDTPQPITPYGRSKLEGEIRVLETENLEWCIVRPPGVYGERDKDFLFAFQAAKNGFFPVLGNPERAYTLVYVHDLVSAILACGTHPGAIGKTYFVGHPIPVSYLMILETLAKLFQKPFKPINLPNGLLEVAAALGELGRFFGQVGLINRSREKDLKAAGWVCDVTAIEQDLGIKCETPLETGFAKTLEWYKQNKRL